MGLPRNSAARYRNSLSRGSSSGCNNRRQQRVKPRGLSPLTNSRVVIPSSATSPADITTLETEISPQLSPTMDSPDAPKDSDNLPVHSISQPLFSPPQTSTESGVFAVENRTMSSNLQSRQESVASIRSNHDASLSKDAENSPVHISTKSRSQSTSSPLKTFNENGVSAIDTTSKSPRLMSRRESVASVRSNYDTYIPNLNAEYKRSPLTLPASAPARLCPTQNSLKPGTKAREFRPTQVPPERFIRQSEIISCIGVKDNSSGQTAPR